MNPFVHCLVYCLPTIQNLRYFLGFMQKSSSVLLGALLLVAVGLLLWKSGPRVVEEVVIPAMPSAKAGGSVSAVLPVDSAPIVDILRDPSFDGINGLKPGFALLDGTRPPELGPEAPSRVRFGLILVRYRGAERASLTSRSKAEALKYAKSLMEEAKTDFVSAVAKGDEGSVASAGWMPRGVLEPAPNYVLFSTAPGQVSGPVDTPTGYWIVKNLSKAK